MYGVLTESSSVAFSTRRFHTATSMTSNIPSHDQTKFDCDSNHSNSTASSNMPALLNSKRKRLDAVLTKLSLSTCKSLTDSLSPKMYKQVPSSEYSQIETTETQTHMPTNQPDSQQKSPHKQLSLDSEMSMTVENLKLEIGETKTQEGCKITTSECTCSVSSESVISDMLLSPVSTRDTSSCCEARAASSKKIETNTSSDLVATSISMSALFTPPTSDSAGGTAEFDDDDVDEDHAKNDQHDLVTDTTTVTTQPRALCTLDGDNSLFGSHQSNTHSEQFKKLPQAKLLSHDSAQKISEKAHVPDAETRSRMLKTLLPAESVSSSSLLCTASLTNKLPNFTGLSVDTLPAFPICQFSHCQNLADRNNLKMPAISHSYNSHSLNSWRWNSSHKQVTSPTSSDPFASLLSPTLKEKREQNFPGSTTTQHHGSQLLPMSPLSKLSATDKRPSSPVKAELSSPNKKRSHSDSDMIPDYFNLIKSLNAKMDNTSRFLHRAESGTIRRNDGRCVPKPLNKTALNRSEQITLQDYPLDLSVKSLSPRAGRHKYSELIAATNSSLGFNSSLSFPSLNSLVSPKHSKFPSPSKAISPLAQSFKTSSDDHKTIHKRRNVSSSDSLYSSSLSSISSQSPLDKHLTDSQSLKNSSPLFALYLDENVKSNMLPSQVMNRCTSFSVTSTMKVCKADTANARPSKPKSASSKHSEKSLTNYHEERTPSLPSLSDLDAASFACPICGQTFALHDRLAKHIASRHKNRQQCESVAKNYLCDVCQRSFARSDMLTRHMRLHTGIKPYTCKICGQVFSRSDHLSTHQRTHTGEKPYKCPQCPYAACRRDMITRHMRTHRYEVPDSSSSIEELSKSA